MPRYEYICQECHFIFDALRPMSLRDAEIKCECGGDGIRRLTNVGHIWAPTRSQQ
jgi:putative FmdB family regulatory protein